MPSKRETCRWAEQFTDIHSDTISACVHPLPAWVLFIDNDVTDADCESCPCWTPKSEGADHAE